jgi:hypothetical protein
MIPRSASTLLVRVALAVLALASTGCMIDSPEPTTLPLWQQQVEQYVRDQGNGDPTVLADLSWDDIHKGFAVIGDPLPDRSTDIIGWLVAHQVVGGKSYFLFLVGTVRRNNLEAVCPVALDVEGDQFRWITGQSNTDALTAYRARGTAALLDANESPPNPPAFPHRGEILEINIKGGEVSVLDRDSGANWSLVLSSSEEIGKGS